MTALMIKCPESGKLVSTGFEISDRDKLSNRRWFTPCPRCKMSHGWTIHDTVSKDDSNAWAVD